MGAMVSLRRHHGKAILAICSTLMEIPMTTTELAHAFTDLLKQGKFDEAGKLYWSDDVVSMEPMPGDMAEIKGRSAVEAKGAWWYANHEIHSVQVEGPYVHGHQFVVRFTMDVTPKAGARMSMDEVGLYSVQEGQIVEERFFFGGAT
jgi:ketosteroid isomerase-like protein